MSSEQPTEQPTGHRPASAAGGGDPGCTVRRLRLADLANLWAEGPTTPSQIALVAEFDATPLRAADGRLDVARIRTELARRTARVPALADRIRWTRAGEGRPAWVAAAGFDPATHITSVTLPAGADLAAWCADRIVVPLDRERPLWRAEIVDGLPDGRFGLLMVLHHVLADGLTGVAIAARLLDDSPDAVAVPGPVTVGPPPAHRTLVREARRARLRALARAVRGVPGLPAAVRRTVRRVRDATGDVRVPAPVTSLPHRVGTGRRLAVVRFPLDAVRAAGRASGATVNDVLLAAVASGLRALFLARGERVDGLTPRVSMPVGAHGHQAGMLLLDLPVGEPDPHHRLAAVHATTTRLKDRLRTGGGDVFDVLDLPGPLARLAVRWGRRHAARHINLFVTDVPGPPAPLWLAGARLLDAVPVAPLSADVPLGIAALSYAGTLAVAVHADAAVTDLDVLATGIADGVTELVPDGAFRSPDGPSPPRPTGRGWSRHDATQREAR